jgi:glycosyltransferase involved in cell wall biosynthesis
LSQDTQGLRVGVVTETFPPDINGVAMTMGRVVDGLVDRGHRVQVVRPRQDGDDGDGFDGRVEHVTVRGMPIPMYKRQKFGFFAGGKLRRLWHRDPANVVYIATEGPLGYSALRAAHKFDLPIVSGFHTNFHTYTGHYKVGFLKPLVERYLRWFHNRTDCTVVPTEEGREQLLQSGYDEVAVMGRGVDVDLFTPERRSPELRAEWGLEPSDLAVVYVGRIAEEKNIDLAARAFLAMREEEPRARFVLVGDGPARERLQRDNPEFIFCGMRTGTDLAAHYASGDVFLFPSVTETFGNVTTEAMASGLAVVNYDYAAGRMYIEHGESGLLVPFDEDEAFVETARTLARDRDLIRRLGRGARRVAEHITWDRIAERFLTICRDSMNGQAEPDR